MEEAGAWRLGRGGVCPRTTHALAFSPGSRARNPVPKTITLIHSRNAALPPHHMNATPPPRPRALTFSRRMPELMPELPVLPPAAAVASSFSVSTVGAMGCSEGSAAAAPATGGAVACST